MTILNQLLKWHFYVHWNWLKVSKFTEKKKEIRLVPVTKAPISKQKIQSNDETKQNRPESNGVNNDT